MKPKTIWFTILFIFLTTLNAQTIPVKVLLLQGEEFKSFNDFMIKQQYHKIYHIALPTDNVSDEEYFEEIADVFGIREQKINRKI